MKLRIQPVAVLVKLALTASWQVGYCADQLVSSAEPPDRGTGSGGSANGMIGFSRLRALDESALALLSLPQLRPSTAYCAAAVHWTARGNVVTSVPIQACERDGSLSLRLDTTLDRERHAVAARASVTEPIAPVLKATLALGEQAERLSDTAAPEPSALRAADQFDRPIDARLDEEQRDALAQQDEDPIPSWLKGAGSLPAQLQFEASIARAEAMLDRLSAARHPQLAQSAAPDYRSWSEVGEGAPAHLSASRQQQFAQDSVHDDASWSEVRARALAWVQTQQRSLTAAAQTPASPSLEPIADSSDPIGGQPEAPNATTATDAATIAENPPLETVRDEPTSLPEPGLQLSHELSGNTSPITRGVLGTVASRDELLAANDDIDLAAAPVPALPHVASDTKNGATGFAADALMVAAVDLDAMRGGFDAPSGLKMSFGIERAVFINGELLATQTINLSNPTDLAGATGAGLGGVSVSASAGIQSAAVVTNVGGTLVIQNGARNVANLPEVRAALPLVVQNSLDNQSISTVTKVTATVPAASILQGILQSRRLNDAVIDAVTRR